MINVYAYQNKINGKIYIGQTCETLERRARRNGIGYYQCDKFYRAIQKYGWTNFEGWIIKIVDTQEEADQEEMFWISEMRNQIGKKNVYNLCSGGLGGQCSDETKKKLSIALKGRA